MIPSLVVKSYQSGTEFSADTGWISISCSAEQLSDASIYHLRKQHLNASIRHS